MKSVLINMLKIYNVEDKDWMSFKITKRDSLTYHHIIKDENGGELSISNGAILTKNAHDFLHCIEHKNMNIYNEINKLFKVINDKQGINCDYEFYQIRNLILMYLEMGYTIPNKMKKSKIKKMMLDSNPIYQNSI